ncbi:unnamed protein product [Clonostachys rosea]|uniref:Uncharacterized protein n=1 Tax=Bionectria ochroleuca TaxID=29856 RepID=A0ABY6UZK5_BIOOC|nr:unnamed protein product [Clonostachys rosea]
MTACCVKLPCAGLVEVKFPNNYDAVATKGFFFLKRVPEKAFLQSAHFRTDGTLAANTEEVDPAEASSDDLVPPALGATDSQSRFPFLAWRLADVEALETAAQRTSNTTAATQALASGLVFLFVHTVNQDNHPRAEPSRIIGN